MTKRSLQERIRELDRRQFIKAGSLLTLGSLILPRQLFAKPDAAPAGGCDPTTDDILGPYYLPGSPVTTLVAQPGEPGDRLFLSGTVLSNCTTPVEGAMVEVWQANDAAVYDTSQAFNLRATFYSDANGQYAFETIMPGAYLNGNQYRPRHIHFRVNKVGFPELITQLYFDGDHSSPPIRGFAAGRSAADHRAEPFGRWPTGRCVRHRVGRTCRYQAEPFRHRWHPLPIHPNPMRELCNIHFNVFHRSRVSLHIADMNGRVLVTLLDEDKVRAATPRNGTVWMAQAVR
ncbi:MAG: hypothetical protein IPH53_19435 [Flavobacteriales bacterium]|nr:hypothetical protein [Flavobacteriales bacterium]